MGLIAAYGILILVGLLWCCLPLVWEKCELLADRIYGWFMK